MAIFVVLVKTGSFVKQLICLLDKWDRSTLYLWRPLRLLPTALALKCIEFRVPPVAAELADAIDACADAIGRFLKPCNFFSFVSCLFADVV